MESDNVRPNSFVLKLHRNIIQLERYLQTVSTTDLSAITDSEILDMKDIEVIIINAAIVSSYNVAITINSRLTQAAIAGEEAYLSLTRGDQTSNSAFNPRHLYQDMNELANRLTVWPVWSDNMISTLPDKVLLGFIRATIAFYSGLKSAIGDGLTDGPTLLFDIAVELSNIHGRMRDEVVDSLIEDYKLDRPIPDKLIKQSYIISSEMTVKQLKDLTRELGLTVANVSRKSVYLDALWKYASIESLHGAGTNAADRPIIAATPKSLSHQPSYQFGTGTHYSSGLRSPLASQVPLPRDISYK